MISGVACSLVLTGCVEGPLQGRGGALIARAEALFGDDLDRCFDDPATLLRVTAPVEAGVTRAADDAGSSAEKAMALGKKNKPGVMRQVTRCEGLVREMQAYEFGKIAFLDEAAKPAAAPAVPAPILVPIPPPVAPAVAVAAAAPGPSLAEFERRRNEVVDALIAVSNRKCGRYSGFLKSYDGTSNSLLSVLAILTGSAGATVTGVTAARILSGSSAAFSGSSSALNQTWFSNQTIHVLVAAFEKARERQQREITNRQACGMKYYSVMDGIADAMNYHSSCSILVGLSETAQAVERSDQPGMETMRRQLADLAAIREKASEFVNASFDGKGGTVGPALDALSKANEVRVDARRTADDRKKALDDLEAATTVTIAAANRGDDAAAIAAKVKADSAVQKAEKAKTEAETAATAAGEAVNQARIKVDSAYDEAVRTRTVRADLGQSVSGFATCPFGGPTTPKKEETASLP